ncbi:hypothetical protein QVD17_00988 [Tagetes erecta]|uniref:Uncharacterized protein n=1 Tax=Tagetes erecta TaxID=13708 RepID=A0AAD8P7Q7_TARER|nr:hypothetical protein QVD17_00988 [Tagetes erecta]
MKRVSHALKFREIINPKLPFIFTLSISSTVNLKNSLLHLVDSPPAATVATPQIPEIFNGKYPSLHYHISFSLLLA